MNYTTQVCGWLDNNLVQCSELLLSFFSFVFKSPPPFFSCPSISLISHHLPCSILLLFPLLHWHWLHTPCSAWLLSLSLRSHHFFAANVRELMQATQLMSSADKKKRLLFVQCKSSFCGQSLILILATTMRRQPNFLCKLYILTDKHCVGGVQCRVKGHVFLWCWLFRFPHFDSTRELFWKMYIVQNLPLSLSLSLCLCLCLCLWPGLCHSYLLECRGCVNHISSPTPPPPPIQLHWGCQHPLGGGGSSLAAPLSQGATAQFVDSPSPSLYLIYNLAFWYSNVVCENWLCVVECIIALYPSKEA